MAFVSILMCHQLVVYLSLDKVFGPASLTEAVYEEGVKNVVLLALMGKNGTNIYFIYLFLMIFLSSLLNCTV